MDTTARPASGCITREERRKEMLAYCLQLLDQADTVYAMSAADFYEKGEPWHLDGLGRRIRKEIEERRKVAADA
jgi:hypothetical protein